MKLFFSSLYLKITLLILGVCAVISIAIIKVTIDSAQENFEQTSQRLNADVATTLLHETPPFVNGVLNKEALPHIMHHMMAVNHSIEVYVLSPKGEILSYVAPHKKIKLTEVDLDPVKVFIQSEGKAYIKGDDPRSPGKHKIFSAAEVRDEGQLLGYVYIVLMSEEYEATSEILLTTFLKDLGRNTIVIILLCTTILAIVIAWFITRYQRTIVKSVRNFKDGNLYERIPVKRNSELNQVAIAYNEMADTILQSMEKIKTIEHLRRELIANVSHDIRTPLSLVKGYIETVLIKEDISDDERVKYMKIALESTDKLQKLVDELFELSKLEASEVRPHKEAFLITDLVQDVSQKYLLLAKEKGITLKPSLNADLPLVHADVELIERVMQNLLDNALKFTPNGGLITIGVEKKGEHIQVEVTDTGEGIPEEQYENLFKRYSKGKSSRNEGGTGLGLAIVKKILELHSASINFKSKRGHGTSFYFNLPIMSS